MNVNWSKTKEMAIVTKGAGSPFDALSFSNNIVEQVHSFKLLGMTISPNSIHQQQELHVLVTASLFMDLNGVRN